MSGINGGHMLTTGFAHGAVLANAEKVISAIKGELSSIFSLSVAATARIQGEIITRNL